MAGYGGQPGFTGSTTSNGTVLGQGGYTAPGGTTHPYTSVNGSSGADPYSLAGSTPPPVANGNGYLQDPGYLAALAQEQMGQSQLNDQLNSARSALITQFGDPNLASLAGFGLDPQAAAFARQNYLSGNATLARLDKQHDLSRNAVINQLAGHGLLNSGDLGYGLTQADQGYGNNVYDAQQQVLQQLQQLASGNLSQQQNLHQSVISALQNAWQNFQNNPAAYGTPASTATANPTAPAAPKAVAKAPAKQSAAQKALAVRSQALNKLYGLG